MAVSNLVVPVVSTINASSITAVAANTLYEGLATFEPAIYTITCASGTIANVEFYNGAAGYITVATTASGTVAINLASTADRVRVWTNTGTNIVVSITKTANALTSTFSGTLDTISTTGSSTYTGTSTSGFGFAVVVGGGGGASAGYAGNGGGGGGSGGVGSKVVALTGSMAVVVGTAGAANSNGVASTFAGITANGGSGAAANTGAGGAGGTVTGATYNVTGNGGGGGGTGTGGGGSGGFGGNPPVTWPFVVSTIGTSGATGTGGGGSGQVGTGFGCGGSGGSQTGPGSGSAGRQGVVYVLRY